MTFEETKDLTQLEFAHRAMTLPSGRLRRHVTVEAYLHAMEMARLGLCREELHASHYDHLLYGKTALERMLIIPNSITQGESWRKKDVRALRKTDKGRAVLVELAPTPGHVHDVTV